MFETFLDPILSWVIQLLQGFCALGVLGLMLLLMFKFRLYPFLFMIGLRGCSAYKFPWQYQTSVHVVIDAHATSIQAVEGNWMCGNVSGVVTEDGIHLQVDDFGILASHLLANCTLEKKGRYEDKTAVIGAHCKEEPAMLKGVTGGMYLVNGWIDHVGNRYCTACAGCQYRAAFRDVCGNVITPTEELSMNQKTELCKFPVVGWIDRDGAHGTVSLPKTPSKSSGSPTGVDRCTGFKVEERESSYGGPYELIRATGVCLRDIWLARPRTGQRTRGVEPTPSVDQVLISPDSYSVATLLWMRDHVPGFSSAETHNGEVFTLTRGQQSFVDGMQKKNMSCPRIGRARTGDLGIHITCSVARKGCMSSCWEHSTVLTPPEENVGVTHSPRSNWKAGVDVIGPFSRGRSWLARTQAPTTPIPPSTTTREVRRNRPGAGASISRKKRNIRATFMWGLWTVSWGGNLDEGLLLKISKVVDSNTGRISMLEHKLQVISEITRAGFCSDGNSSAHGRVNATFDDGERITVVDWCNRGSFEAFMSKAPLEEHHLSDTVRAAIKAGLLERRVSKLVVLALWAVGTLFLMAILRGVYRMKAAKGSHYHLLKRGKSGNGLCVASHRFGGPQSVNCRCGLIKVDLGDCIVRAPCNNRTLLPMVLRKEEPLIEIDTLESNTSELFSSELLIELQECSTWTGVSQKIDDINGKL